jgi:hypothetical protein
MSQPRERSFAEVWSTAQHDRSLCCRLMLRRAYRVGRAWFRRHRPTRDPLRGAYGAVAVSRARQLADARLDPAERDRQLVRTQ